MTNINSYRRKQLLYILTDLVSALLVWVAFLLFRWLVYEGHVMNMDILIPAFSFYRPLILYPVFCVMIHYLSGYYLRPFRKKATKELATTFGASLIIAIFAFFVIIIDDKVSDYHRYLMSLVVLFGLQFIISYIPRLVIRFCDKYKGHPIRIYTLESPEDIPNFKEKHQTEHYDEVFIAYPKKSKDSDIYNAINQLYPLGVEISIAPRTYDFLTGAARFFDIGHSPKIFISKHKMPDHQICIKRAFDICVALVFTIVFSPLYLILAILVKCSSEGPVLYRQERIGLHGIPFEILKFRTMYVNAEPTTPQLTEENDPRITSVGRWMRKYRLDELPQMWNILNGDMSIVGPRPERAFFIEQIQKVAPYYCLIYRLRPGLTSWGPVKVGYTDTIEKMVERLNYDIAYMENMSISLDVRILLSTISVLIEGKGK